MKKFLALLLVLAMALTMLAGCSSGGGSDKKEGASGASKIAMITDYGDITDQSFNQSTYEACKEYSEKNGNQFKYYKPTGNSTEARVASFNAAVADGYDTIVVPGYAFGEMIQEVAEKNSDIKIIAIDVSAGDFAEGYKVPANVCTFTYQEELAGYMAGYAAVMDGYEKLGFLGGIAVPAVIRYGFGFVQGANDAAKVKGNVGNVEINYVYGGTFGPDPAVTAVMDTWYSGGTQVVFACGGGIYASACEAAVKTDGKIIGVDVDQAATIDGTYNVKGLCITSAMKGLGATVKAVLADVDGGKWDTYSGKISNLGLVSGDDVEINYVQLPTASWTMQNFTMDDYKALVKDMYDGKIKVSADTAAMPAVDIKVTTFDNILG